MYSLSKKFLILALSLNVILATAQPQALPYVDMVFVMGEQNLPLVLKELESTRAVKEVYGISNEHITELTTLLPRLWKCLKEFRVDSRFAPFWASLDKTIEHGMQAAHYAEPAIATLQQYGAEINDFALKNAEAEVSNVKGNPLPKLAAVLRKTVTLMTNKLKNKPEHKLFVDHLTQAATHLEEAARKTVALENIIMNHQELQSIWKRLEAITNTIKMNQK